MVLAIEDRATTDEWLLKGAESLIAFWKPDESCFLRTTGGTVIGGGSNESPFTSVTGATSSNRSFLAATEILFHLTEERRFDPRAWRGTDGSGVDADRWQDVGSRLLEIWRGMATSYYPVDLELLRNHSDNGENDFSDSHLLVSLALLHTPFSSQYLWDEDESPPNTATADKLEGLSHRFEQTIKDQKGARISERGPTHPLLTLHAVRAIEVARHVDGRTDGRSRVSDLLESIVRHAARDDLLRQLGLHAARDSEFDPGALVGSLCLLHRFAGMSGRRLVETGIELLRESQDKDGTWNNQILTGDHKLVYVPSLEISVALANLALADLSDGSDRIATLAAPTLERSLDFLESGYREMVPETGAPSSGWANDQVRQPAVVESWSTALAMMLLMRVRRIARRLDQHQVLGHYRCTFPSRPRREWLRWPDLAGPLPLVRSQEAEEGRARRELERISDPTATGAVDTASWSKLVQPTLASPFDRPTAMTSFLLYGPPGTRKSSMVGAVAAALDWPLVTLAPPDFLTDGIAKFEARAEAIFRDLLRLRRVVVFFDECEELFRRRMLTDAGVHRTQSDFITSGMLPRLQDLRNQQWVVFAIATNTELDELDPAVVRFGRLDGQQRIGQPELDAQVRYLQRGGALSEELLEVVSRALVRYDRFIELEAAPEPRKKLQERRRKQDVDVLSKGHLTEYFKEVNRLRVIESQLDLVSFAVLDQLAATLVAESLHSSGSVDEDRVYELIQRLAGARGRPRQWSDT